jgi:tetratricopeptide (TPR) repeat protein
MQTHHKLALSLAFVLCGVRADAGFWVSPIDGGEVSKHQSLVYLPKSAGPTCQELSGMAIKFAQQDRWEQANAEVLRATGDGPGIGVSAECSGVIFNNIAVVAQSSGNLAMAERFARDSIAILQTAHGPEDSSLFAPLQILTAVFLDRSEIGNARQTASRLLAVHLDSPDRRAILWELMAGLFQLEGKALEAEKAYRAALQFWERTGSSHGKQSLSALSNLCTFYIQERRYAEAREVLHRADAIVSATPGVNRVIRSGLLNSAAILCFSEQDYLGADDALREAIEIIEVLPKALDGQIRVMLINRALVLRKLRRKKEAKELATRASTFCVAPNSKRGSNVVDLVQLQRSVQGTKAAK